MRLIRTLLRNCILLFLNLIVFRLVHVNCIQMKDIKVDNWDYEDEIDDKYMTSDVAHKRVSKNILEGTVVQEKPQLFYRLIRYTK